MTKVNNIFLLHKHAPPNIKVRTWIRGFFSIWVHKPNIKNESTGSSWKTWWVHTNFFIFHPHNLSSSLLLNKMPIGLSSPTKEHSIMFPRKKLHHYPKHSLQSELPTSIIASIVATLNIDLLKNLNKVFKSIFIYHRSLASKLLHNLWTIEKRIPKKMQSLQILV